MGKVFTGRSLRKLLKAILRQDTDIDVFLIDFFPEIKKRCSNGMSTEAKLNELLLYSDEENVIKALHEHDPDQMRLHKDILRYEAEEQESMSRQIQRKASVKTLSTRSCILWLQELKDRLSAIDNFRFIIPHFSITDAEYEKWCDVVIEALEKSLGAEHKLIGKFALNTCMGMRCLPAQLKILDSAIEILIHENLTRAAES
jgi:hypothetical protein